MPCGGFLSRHLARKRTNLFGRKLPIFVFDNQDLPGSLQGFRNGWCAYAKALGDSGLTNSLNQFWQWRLLHFVASAIFVSQILTAG
jgi:hypothetical protein